MLAIILTLVFALDITLAVLSARAEPGTLIRTVALVAFGAQLLTGVVGGVIAMLRFT